MKLEIIGSVASGKTTLARKLSEKYRVLFYEKDNIVWERTPDGDRRRPAVERDRMFGEIIASENWIVEGSPRKILRESFAHSDYILFLDVNTGIRLFRVLRRWLRQKSGREAYNSKPTLDFLRWNIKWVFEFNAERKELIGLLSEYGDKFRMFKNAEQAMRFVGEIYGDPADCAAPKKTVDSARAKC